MAFKDPKGYGRFPFGKEQRAHRVMWFFEHGNYAPTGTMVCHTCDNRSCVNPNHLYLGNAKSNSKDMVDRGRSLKGRTGKVGGYFHKGKPKPSISGHLNGNARFTKEEVDQIRKFRENGYILQWIADKYRCAESTVSRICRGENYRG